MSDTPLMITDLLLALDLPLKLLFWQSTDARVCVSSMSAAFLQARYGVPEALIGTIAGDDAVIAHTLGNNSQ